MNKFSFIAVLFFIISGSLSAQTKLNLERSLSIALNESYNVKSAEYSLISSEKQLEAVRLGLRTNVMLDMDIPYYSRNLASKFNPVTGNEEFYEVGTTRIEGALSLNQPIAYTNGTLSLVGSLFGRDQYSEFTGTTRDYFSNLSIRLRQPFLTFNNQEASLERAEINLERAKRSYTQAERDIVYNVTASFYNLFQAGERLKIAKETARQSEEQYETALNKYKAGLIAEVEAMQLEVELASSKNDLLNAERYFIEAKNDFKLLIGLNMDEEIEIEDSLSFSPVVINEERLTEEALAKRTELLNAVDEIKLNEYEIDEINSEGRLRGEIYANYGINKSDEDFNDIFHNFLEDRVVSVTMSLPILDWGRNSRLVEAAEARMKQTKAYVSNLRESIKRDIIASINRLQAAEARVKVLERTVEIAQKSYDISLERFKAGKVTSFDLSQVQLRLTNAKLNSISAIIDYKTAIADLERKSMMDLD